MRSVFKIHYKYTKYCSRHNSAKCSQCKQRSIVQTLNSSTITAQEKTWDYKTNGEIAGTETQSPSDSVPEVSEKVLSGIFLVEKGDTSQWR